MIAAVLVVELIFGAFLLLQKSSRSDDADGATRGTVMAATDPRFGDSHVTVGSVAVTAQPEPPASMAAQLPAKPETPPDFNGSTGVKARIASRGENRRDGMYRHSSNPVAQALTDELVKESAKLDPSLPPPELPGRVVVEQPGQPDTYQASRSDPYRPGSNPVASAMTEQLVKESAKLDPALPPPDPSGAKPASP
ncbi:hypothetical protein PQQ51_15875 [Paraburkholderia xenovorans]|uniref:hypothetical protein n=1 Tax=Paraburkholderia xenovorans TaxID=36873 RepID=UPI0038BB38D3